MDQRLEALEVANRKRAAIAKAGKGLRDGSMTLSDVFADPDTGPAKIAKILASQRMWGPVKTAGFLDAVNIRPLTRLDQLSDRQKSMIVAAVDSGVIETVEEQAARGDFDHGIPV